MTPPVRRQQFKVAPFAAYLAKNGAEIGKPTNQYELIRYRAFWQGSAKAVTHIVYTKENGLLTYMGASREHYRAFLNDEPLPDTMEEADEIKRVGKLGARAKKVRASLLERDGDECWFCGGPLGDDATIEHLIPKVAGGTNNQANLCLAHSDCNRRADDKPLPEKLALRNEMRAKAQGTHTGEKGRTEDTRHD